MFSARSLIVPLLMPLFIFGVFAVVRRSGIDYRGNIWKNLRAVVSGGSAGQSAATSSLARTGIEVSRSGTVIQLRLRAAAQSVLFFAEGGMIAAPIYLGSGVSDGAGRWEYRFDANDNVLPNGGYLVYGQVANNNTIQNTAGAIIYVNSPLDSWNQNRAAFNEKIGQSEAAIETGNLAVEENIATTSQAILARLGSDVLAKENIRKISDAVRAMEYYNSWTQDKTAQRREIDVRVRGLEDEAAGYLSDALRSARLDKLKELAEAKKQRDALDREITGYPAKIEQKNQEREALENEILALAKSEEDKNTVKAELDDFSKNSARIGQEIIENQNILSKDSDADGLSDALEAKLGTDPYDPDTDGDAAFDGDEAENNYNPFEPDEFSRKSAGDPRLSAPKMANVYTVDNVGSGEFSDDKKVTYFKGRGLPNAFFELNVYSVPLAVMVRDDSKGKWIYTLDYPLSDGQHSAYTVRLDSQGKVQARSEPLIFTKKGNQVETVADQPTIPPSASLEDLKTTFRTAIAFLIFLAILTAMLVIGFVLQRTQRVIR